jgi:concanavalin A-like lectin/glucanase superfamily protein/thrombospondin type 3 repeat protein
VITYTHDGSANSVDQFTYNVSDDGGALSNAAMVRVTASSLPIPGSGLVAAYAFDENGGTRVLDTSGNGNDGTVSGGALWSTGHSGQALVLDGIDGIVLVPDSTSLHLSIGFTFEAWISLTSPAASRWQVFLEKEPESYFFKVDTGLNRLGLGGVLGGVCCTTLESPVAPPLEEWTHVAATWDGAAFRQFINGTQTASQPSSGTLEVNGFPLRIGGSTNADEFLHGRIDDLRIYNRALTAAEILQDSSTPVAGLPSVDVTPPVRSAGSPHGSLSAGTTQTLLSLTTNEVASCRYDTVPDASYASLPSTFSTPDGTAHSTTVTGLVDGQTYTFYVRCQDTAPTPNANPDDFLITFSIASDLDGDGVQDELDDCPGVSDPDQTDRDGDGIGDACDLCADYPSPDNSDINRNGIGDVCECGDQNGDGTVNVSDLIAINHAIFDPSQATPLCDANDDGSCNVSDIVAANRKIFGWPAYCSRYPPPGDTSALQR